MDAGGIITGSILLGVLFFVVGRGIVCWYFKLTRITGLLEEINRKLAVIAGKE